MSPREPTGHAGATTRARLYAEAALALRPRQVVTRLRRPIPPAVLAAGLRIESAPDVAAAARGLGADPAPPWGPQGPLHETGRFAALGRTRGLDSPGAWESGGDPLLFLFWLHGFAPLATYAAGRRTAEGDAFWAARVRSWLERHARPSLPAWHPAPTSDRVIAWAAAVSALDGWPASLRHEVAAAIAYQAAYLRRAIEHDVGGNHVVRNATALAFAGAVLPRTDHLDRGLRLLERECARQVLADGGHEERSPAYHRRVLHDVDDVARLLEQGGRRPPGWLAATRERMSAWLSALAGPDGELPLLNDAWRGPPVRPAGEPLVVLAPSGYVVVREEGDQSVVDVAPLCPPHLPPHAHADALSFVLWADGSPVLCDRGAFAYTGGERDRYRGTPAHSTVTVDGEDQCVFWGDFRAGRLPRVRSRPPRTERGWVTLAGAHDGYRRLPDPVTHHRVWAWASGVGLVVVDRLAATRSHRVASALHLAPGQPARVDAAGPFAVTALGAGAHPSLRPAGHAPWLGVSEPAHAIVDERDLTPGALFGWALLRPPWTVAALDPTRLVLAGRDERREVALEWAR